MKAMFCFMALMFLGLQFSCTANQKIARTKLGSPRELSTPQVAVMPMKDGVLIGWKPVANADGYFIYRETENPPAKNLLGIGPKVAQGFIDHDPPEVDARYSVQAFKVSDLSEKMQSKATSMTHPIPRVSSRAGRAVAMSD